MSNIYIDIGNTMIKINYLINGKDKYLWYNTHEEFSSKLLFNKFPNELKIYKAKNIYISSVVPTKNTIVQMMSENYFKIKPIFINIRLKTELNFAVDNPKMIGADLISLAALINSKNKNAIMINLGTATTIIHVKNQIFQGAIIAPGLITSSDSIIDKTSLLQKSQFKIFKKNIGKNTYEALSIGIFNAHSEMIKGLVSKIDLNAEIYFSGGNALKIKELIDYIYIKEATIEGMKILSILNEDK